MDKPYADLPQCLLRHARLAVEVFGLTIHRDLIMRQIRVRDG